MILDDEKDTGVWRYFNCKFEYEDMFHDFDWPWAGHKYFAYDLIRNVKPKIIVELGTHKGTSFFSFCQAVKDAHYDANLYAVDAWRGDEHTGFYDDNVFEEVNEIKEKYYGNLKIELLRETFDEAVNGFENNSIDLLHIDGFHTYAAVKNDFEKWFPKVKKDGIILLHDIFISRSDFGVYKLWEKLKNEFKTIEFTQSYGLGVLFKNNNCCQTLIDKEREWQIRYSYIAEDKKNEETRKSLNNFEQSLAEWNAVIADRDAQIANLNQTVQTLSGQVVERDAQIANLNQILAERDQSIQTLTGQVAERDAQIANLNQAVQTLAGQVAQRDAAVTERDTQLAAITGSRGWRLLKFLWRLRLIAAPRGSLRERYLRFVLQGMRALLRMSFAKRIKLIVRRVLSPSLYVCLRQFWHRIINQLPRRLPAHTEGKTELSYSDSFGVPKSYDVICFPIIEWDHRFQRPQQLMTRFAQDGHRVFYLNLTFHDRSAAAEWRKVTERIFQVQLPGPVNLDRFFESLSPDVTGQCLEALEEFCANAGIRESICIVQLPFWTPLALNLREKFGWKVIFDCMDEHHGLTMLKPEMQYDESRLVRKADIVLVSAKKLWDKHAHNASRLMLLPNAVDFDHFSGNTNGHELDTLPRPVIGYYGAIMEWFDAGMLIGVATARPDWSFVLIGKVDTSSVNPLRKLPNVIFLGEQPYSQLPGYLHQFDVCLIPFKVMPIIESTNPVKFYEYLSAGKPVVALPMAELLPYPELFYPASNAEEVVEQIAQALKEDSPALAGMRINWARHETWQARYERLAAAVSDLHGLVSIIIVSYHNLEKLQACIESIIEKTHYPCYEVIVVDNGSTPDVVGYLTGIAQKHSHFRVIFNQKNMGFAQANNIGLQAISKDSQYIILLNNDTVVTYGWMTGLTRWLNDRDVGLVGPVTCPSGAANEAAVPVDYNELDKLESFAQRYTIEHRGIAFDIPMLAMYCLAMRRDTYEEIGPLDEQFGAGMFEDDDYSLRARIKGYRVICAEDVFVHHFGRASFSQMSIREYQQLFNKNLCRYEAKWNIKWRLHSGR